MSVNNVIQVNDSLVEEKKYTEVNASSKIVVQNIKNIKLKKSQSIMEDSFDPTLLRKVVDQIRTTFNMFDTRLHFRVNMEANSVVVEVVDSKTNVVIRQIPSEDIQKLKLKIQEMTGAFVDTEA